MKKPEKTIKELLQQYAYRAEKLSYIVDVVDLLRMANEVISMNDGYIDDEDSDTLAEMLIAVREACIDIVTNE